MRPQFECPPSMVRHVKEVLAGSYDIPGLEFERPPVVIDCGANVGSFAIWACKRWPGAAILAIEPHPENFRALCRNVASFPVSDCRQAAVVDEPGKHEITLYAGKNNCGEASLYLRAEQVAEGSMKVKTQQICALPKCDVLKVDTEGEEMPIIFAYVPQHQPRAVMYEAHSQEDRNSLSVLMHAQGYDCISDVKVMPDRWVAKWRLPR